MLLLLALDVTISMGAGAGRRRHFFLVYVKKPLLPEIGEPVPSHHAITNQNVNPRKLVLVRDWKDTLTTVKSLRRLRGAQKKGKWHTKTRPFSTIAKSMKWALDISWFGVFDFSRAVSAINFSLI